MVSIPYWMGLYKRLSGSLLTSRILDDDIGLFTTMLPYFSLPFLIIIVL